MLGHKLLYFFRTEPFTCELIAKKNIVWAVITSVTIQTLISVERATWATHPFKISSKSISVCRSNACLPFKVRWHQMVTFIKVVSAIQV